MMGLISKIFVLIIVCGIVSNTLGINVMKQQLRKLHKRLTNVEDKTLATEITLEDMLLAITTLNDSLCDCPFPRNAAIQFPGEDMPLADEKRLDIAGDISQLKVARLDIAGDVSQLKVAFMEEKRARKQALDSLKDEITIVAQRTIETELSKVNEAIAAGREMRVRLASQIDRIADNGNITIPLAIFRSNVTEAFADMKLYVDEQIANITIEVGTFLEEMGRNLTSTLAQVSLELRMLLVHVFMVHESD